MDDRCQFVFVFFAFCSGIYHGHCLNAADVVVVIVIDVVVVVVVDVGTFKGYFLGSSRMNRIVLMLLVETIYLEHGVGRGVGW